MFANPPVFAPFKFDNKMSGEIYGGELASKFQLLKRWRLQANVENLFNAKYYLNADSNTNITPGSPRSLRIGLTARF